MPVISIDPPIGGLNAFDSVDAMPPTDAVVLTNWIPRSGYVESRSGYSEHVSGLGGPVETLVAWKGVTDAPIPTVAPRVDYHNTFGGSGKDSYQLAQDNFQLLAAADGKIFNVTTEPPVELGAGFGNDRWQTAMFNNRLVMVNGEDPPMEYSGMVLTQMSTWQLWDPFIGPDGDWKPFPEPEKLLGCVSFKGRMYYWKDNEQKFYYAQAGGYTNEMFEFNLGDVVQQGGKIVSVFTWTVDPGVGPDDMLVFLFDTGEFLIYQGDDPGNIGYFEQVGRFTMPDPISTRCTVAYGADVIVLTRTGFVSMTSVMQGKEVASDFPSFSRKISRLLLDDTLRNADFFGHEAIQTDSGFLIFNMPSSEQASHQYVMNPNNRAWCRMEGLNAVTYETFKNGTFFGGFDGAVYRLGGYNDNGKPIELNAVPAFNYLGDAGVQKQIVAAQIISTHPEPKLIGVGGIADFNFPPVKNVQPPPGAIGDTLWNVSYWSETVNEDDYFWNRSGQVIGGTTKGWHNVHAFGYAVTLYVHMKVDTQVIQWRQTGLRYRMGGAQ